MSSKFNPATSHYLLKVQVVDPKNEFLTKYYTNLASAQELPEDAGVDIPFATEHVEFDRTKASVCGIIEFNLGVKMNMYWVTAEGPIRCAYYLKTRSSCGKTPVWLSNCEGIMDKGFIGECKAMFRYDANAKNPNYETSHPLLQAVGPLLLPIKVEITPSLEESARGINGIGSTNKKRQSKKTVTIANDAVDGNPIPDSLSPPVQVEKPKAKRANTKKAATTTADSITEAQPIVTPVVKKAPSKRAKTAAQVDAPIADTSTESSTSTQAPAKAATGKRSKREVLLKTLAPPAYHQETESEDEQVLE